MPVGLTRRDIDYLLQVNDDVVAFERVEGATAMWNIAVSVDGGPPVRMIADNGINEIYFQALIQVDAAHVAEALHVLQPFATVGLVMLGENGLWMRSAFFLEFSNMHALSNCIRGIAMAHRRYEDAIAA